MDGPDNAALSRRCRRSLSRSGFVQRWRRRSVARIRPLDHRRTSQRGRRRRRRGTVARRGRRRRGAHRSRTTRHLRPVARRAITNCWTSACARAICSATAWASSPRWWRRGSLVWKKERDSSRCAEAAMARAAANTEGSMVAVMGGDDGARDALETLDDVWIANINGTGQIVVSGTREGLDDLLARHRDLGWRRATPLPVGGAFHSPLMAPAQARVRRGTRTAPRGAPRRRY